MNRCLVWRLLLSASSILIDGCAADPFRVGREGLEERFSMICGEKRRFVTADAIKVEVGGAVRLVGKNGLTRTAEYGTLDEVVLMGEGSGVGIVSPGCRKDFKVRVDCPEAGFRILHRDLADARSYLWNGSALWLRAGTSGSLKILGGNGRVVSTPPHLHDEISVSAGDDVVLIAAGPAFGFDLCMSEDCLSPQKIVRIEYR